MREIILRLINSVQLFFSIMVSFIWGLNHDHHYGTCMTFQRPLENLRWGTLICSVNLSPPALVFIFSRDTVAVKRNRAPEGEFPSPVAPVGWEADPGADLYNLWHLTSNPQSQYVTLGLLYCDKMWPFRGTLTSNWFIKIMLSSHNAYSQLPCSHLNAALNKVTTSLRH